MMANKPTAPELSLGYGGRLAAMTDDELRAKLRELNEWLARGYKAYRTLYLASRRDVRAELQDRANRVMATREGRIGEGL
jgi:hypothetical protein